MENLWYIFHPLPRFSPTKTLLPTIRRLETNWLRNVKPNSALLDLLFSYSYSVNEYICACVFIKNSEVLIDDQKKREWKRSEGSFFWLSFDKDRYAQLIRQKLSTKNQYQLKKHNEKEQTRIYMDSSTIRSYRDNLSQSANESAS